MAGSSSVKNNSGVDLTGQRFGRLLVTARAASRHGARFHCICDCGSQVVARASNLRGGYTRSCGCLKYEETSKRRRKHGHSVPETSEYRTWKSLKGRCNNPNDKAFHNYGDRGITICDRWRNSFENFFADMGPRPPNLSLERIDNDGNYEPGNCVWDTRRKQNRNQRRTKLTEHKAALIRERFLAGLSSREIASEFGVTKSTVRKINRGELWSRSIGWNDPDL